MQKPPFRFKQFSIAQDKCAMKVNTDGVLLGAWADVDGAETILDIGTGTGVIALMIAQRNQSAIIDGIEIDASAYEQAKENFTASNWGSRLNAHHISLQDYFPDKKYDLIISNPPYFIDDHKAGDHLKNIAKHGISLSYIELIIGISRLLTEMGEAFIVLPIFNLAPFELLAAEEKLLVTKLTQVRAVEGKEPYLALIKLCRVKNDYSRSTITIQNSQGEFTSGYKELTREFYLKF
jgi:tRNA1Val (adenine37-N6)-methyltransferase